MKPDAFQQSMPACEFQLKFANMLHSMLREDLNKKSEIREITFFKNKVKKQVFIATNRM